MRNKLLSIVKIVQVQNTRYTVLKNCLVFNTKLEGTEAKQLV